MLRYGVGDLGATLAARVLGTIGEIILTNSRDTDGYPFAVFFPLNSDLPAAIFRYEGALAYLPFPYAVLVEADGPV